VRSERGADLAALLLRLGVTVAAAVWALALDQVIAALGG
jgi:hypothetical protein